MLQMLHRFIWLLIPVITERFSKILVNSSKINRSIVFESSKNKCLIKRPTFLLNLLLQTFVATYNLFGKNELFKRTLFVYNFV